MGGEALYERYKDALRRGHVASLRGRLEEALTAYSEAAAIAPERATPHASAGTALMRRKRPADALRQFDAALRLAPRDEAALLGRAQALVALGRRTEAADAYDTLADMRATVGKLSDAVDAERRALELAEGRERRRTLGRLIEQLRESEPGEPGRAALEKALLALEGVAVTAAPALAVEAAAEGATVEVPPAEPAPPGPLDRDLPADLDIDALAREVNDVIERGEPTHAIDRVLDLAAAYRRDGREDASLDTCYMALSVAPDDARLHLALVALYDGRGWATLADEKLDLLDRLAALDDDRDSLTRIADARAARA